MKPLDKSDPQQIGGFTLVGVLGDGGMGKVYLASKSAETFALKVMRAETLPSLEAKSRLSREVEILKKITMPT